MTAYYSGLFFQEVMIMCLEWVVMNAVILPTRGYEFFQMNSRKVYQLIENTPIVFLNNSTRISFFLNWYTFSFW